MPTLIVRLEEGERRIPFTPGPSLRDILDTTAVRVRSGCRGMGACGLCRVRIEGGAVGEPTPNERIYLNHHEVAQGIRLACQVVPEQDLQIVILAPAPESNWRSLAGRKDRRMGYLPDFPSSGKSPTVESPHGVAVDLGTTHISLSLYCLSSGRWLTGRYGLNPQMYFGSDVMTRLVAAPESPERARAMSRQAVGAIGEGLWDIATREGMDLHTVVRLALVGNTAMLALLSGRNYAQLLQPRYWMSAIDCLPENTDAWAVAWGIHPQARIEVVPPLAGFVGSDLPAGVLATDLTENGPGSLLIDFGTNSEIALWDGDVLWVTSAAGGPAFEGCGLSCGLPAEPGAIYRINLHEGTLDIAVIADLEPLGICGSGMVDLVANMVRSGKLTNMGRFAPTVSKEGFAVVRGERDILLTKGDVDVFQRAKAAIAVGVRALLARADMGYRDLRRICVGGTFGRFLNVANAQEVGLLPKIRPELIELCGNTALAGCEDVLFSGLILERLNSLSHVVKVINLAQYPDFDDLFLENLYLQPT